VEDSEDMTVGDGNTIDKEVNPWELTHLWVAGPADRAMLSAKAAAVVDALSAELIGGLNLWLRASIV
jgi:hypothetical protein